MESRQVDLSKFRAGDFDRGAGFFKEALWVLTSHILFRSCPVSLSALKCVVLRMFGASVGEGVVIKPDVRITFPWRLTIGNHVWIGEDSWLLNLAAIEIQDNACISQRAFLCTGSHDYKSTTFDLIARPIVIEAGAWIAAGAWVGPGVRVGKGAVLTAMSAAAHDLVAETINSGNPASTVRSRVLER